MKALVDWAAKAQGATARSTPEAELVSAGDVMFGLAIPLQESLDQFQGRSLDISLGLDNDAPRSVIKSGHSKRLAHVKRHQLVSIGSLHDAFGK